jgi:hypothetical protein
MIEAAARGVVVIFWLATAAYAWLVSVPFVHENFVQPRVLPGLLEFAEWHRWLTIGLWPVAWLGLRQALGHARARHGARLILGGWGVAGVAQCLMPSLATLSPGGVALAVSVVALVAPLLFALVDLLAAPPIDGEAAADRTVTDLAAALTAAGGVVGVYGAQAAFMGSATFEGLLTSALTHVVFVALFFLLVTVSRSGAALSARPAAIEFWLGTCLLAASLASVMVTVVVPTLSIGDLATRGVGAAIGGVVGLVLAARGRLSGARGDDGVLLALSGFVPLRLTRAPAVPGALCWLVVVATVAWSLDAASRVMDWSSVLATLGVVTVWLLALAGAFATVGRAGAAPAQPAAAWASFAVCLLLLGAYHAMVPPASRAEPAPAVRSWSRSDPSFRVLGGVVRPPAPADRDFYGLLQRHTNLGPQVAVTPVPVRHAPLDGGAGESRPPHVFVFVIDSLRRDYVSPYNPRVRFTPALARFASESVVFERAFTRYGATGLSVPSIWVGGLVPHKQYPEPFAPMNALYALLRHERYTSWISFDNIVDEIVPKDGTGPALDTATLVKDLRFCRTVGEIRDRLATVVPDGPPVFTWALPQDIHVAVITREGATSVSAGDYQGFYAPYASRVERLDACFGAFVDDLEARGLYDDSVIVVTADHGDSLGEEGRWGHAYTIYPEILQIPLLVHLPSRLRDRFEWDVKAPASTADLTPSLYALLGHTPTPPSPIFGETRFWPKGQPPPPRLEDGALVASSYGSVYGWLSNRGHELYVSDGVDFRDYRFEMDGSAAGKPLPVTEEARQAGQDAIRRSLGAIATFYRFDPEH